MKSKSRKPENKSKRKRTQKQLAASRRNGNKSKGPITGAGKAISARNRTTHGLCAYKNLLLDNEDPPALDLLREGYFFRFQPADSVESDLVDQMVAAQWRLRRYSGVETALLDEEMQNQTETLPPPAYEGERCARAFKSLADNSTSLALSARYLSRLTRDYYRAMNAFFDLREKLPPPPGSSPEPKVTLPPIPGITFPFEPEDDLTPVPSIAQRGASGLVGDTEAHQSSDSPQIVDPRVPPMGRPGPSGVSPSAPRTSTAAATAFGVTAARSEAAPDLAVTHQVLIGVTAARSEPASDLAMTHQVLIGVTAARSEPAPDLAMTHQVLIGDTAGRQSSRSPQLVDPKAPHGRSGGSSAQL